MANDVIWMRLGDGDDYHALDDLDSIADVFAQFGIKEIEHYCLYGVTAPGFEGHNYISLYWGPDPDDGTAEASRELTDDELIELQKMLNHQHDVFANG